MRGKEPVVKRRDFLKSLAVVSAGIGVPGVFAKAAVASAAENSAGTGRTLIVVQLAGGLDGLNTVIPYTDGAYYDHRPQLAIPEAEMLVVNDRIAFHPSLPELAGLMQDGSLAVVEGVGYPDPTFSHFKAMDIWQSADVSGTAREGWLGKYFEDLADAGGHPLAEGLAVGGRLPSAFESSTATIPTVGSLDTFALQAPSGANGQREAALLQLYDLYRPAGSSYGALLDTTLDSLPSTARRR